MAYIDRAEAWKVYMPRFRQQAGAFTELFAEAEKENEPFRKALRFIAAQNFSRSADFQNADIFGQLLHPEKMNVEFAAVRSSLAKLPGLLDSARRNASVYIECPGDFEASVATAFSREFSALGFPVANFASAASAVCRVTITEGMQHRELGIFYHPSLQAVISANKDSTVLFAFSAEGERASAVTADVAKRRAYQSLADKVKEKFRAEFSVQSF